MFPRHPNKDSLAAFLDFVFQPLLVVSYGAIYFLFREFVSSSLQSTLIPDASAVLVALLMASIVALLVNRIHSPDNPLSNDVVAATGAIALAATTVGFSLLEAINRIIVVGAVGVMAAILVGALVRMFFKVSGHMLMFSFVVTGLIMIVNSMFSLAYLLLLPVAWSRVRLKKHTVEQAVLGTVLGLTIAVLGYWVLNILRLL